MSNYKTPCEEYPDEKYGFTAEAIEGWIGIKTLNERCKNCFTPEDCIENVKLEVIKHFDLIEDNTAPLVYNRGKLN